MDIIQLHLHSKTPSYTYTDTGKFRVILKITTIQGCIAYDTTYIKVGSKPNAEFSATPRTVCPNREVYLSNLSTGQRITGYYWEFGDNNTSRTNSPIKKYSRPGCYTITLHTYFHGCEDEETKTDYVCVKNGAAFFWVQV